MALPFSFIGALRLSSYGSRFLMISELQPQFEALETSRRRVEALIESLPIAAFQAPKPGEWTALQIAEHLVLSDETVGLARDHKPGRARRFIWVFILAGFRCNVRFPLPSPELEPSGAVPWPELRARWNASRAKLRSRLESLNDSTQQERPFAHPIAGALTARQLLQMGAVHTDYHRRQLERLVKST